MGGIHTDGLYISVERKRMEQSISLILRVTVKLVIPIIEYVRFFMCLFSRGNEYAIITLLS
jgi:hypothetical protein